MLKKYIKRNKNLKSKKDWYKINKETQRKRQNSREYKNLRNCRIEIRKTLNKINNSKRIHDKDLFHFRDLINMKQNHLNLLKGGVEYY